MGRRISLAVLAMIGLAAILPARAWIAQKGGTVTTTKQILMMTSSSNAGGSGTDIYFPAMYSGWRYVSEAKYSVIAAPGTISGMRYYSTTAPAGAATYTMTLRKNGSNTTLACTVTSSSANKCTSSNSVAVVAGDYLSFVLTSSGSPGATRSSASLIFTPTTANDTILSGWSTGFSNASVTGVHIQNADATPLTVSTRTRDNFPDSGTVDKLYVISTAPGAGTSYDYTLDKNAAVTAVTCQVAGTATTCNDTTHSFLVVTGNSGQFQASPTGTPASSTVGFGMRYLPDTTGYFALIGSQPPTGDSAFSTTYFPVTGGYGDGTTTEIAAQGIANAMTVTKISVVLSAAPGVGTSRVFTLRKNGADTTCTVTISGTNTGGAAACSVSIADDDLLATADAVGSGAPTSAYPAISYLAH